MRPVVKPLWAVVAAVAVTLVATPLSGVLEEVNIVMLFLLGVVGIAMRFGRGPAALAALLCGAYDPEPDERVVVVVCCANTDPASVA